MMSTDYSEALSLAEQYSAEVLYHALAVSAIQNTQMMLGDFVKDPAYVASQGLPTRESFVTDAVNYMYDTQPTTVGEAMAHIADTKLAGDNAFEGVCRLAVANVLKQYPFLRKVTIDL
jgi:hypothetical protein